MLQRASVCNKKDFWFTIASFIGLSINSTVVAKTFSSSENTSGDSLL